MIILTKLFERYCQCLTHKNMRINELTTQDMKDINKSLKEFKEGKFTTLKDLKKELDL